MTAGLRTVIYPVTDLARATALFAALVGAEPTWEQPFYVQFEVAGQQLGLDPNGAAQGMTGPVGFWHVDDLDKTRQALLDAGARPHGDVRDFGPRRIATVVDPDGNVIGLLEDS